MRGTSSPSSLVTISVQLLIGRSSLIGKAAKEGSRRLARMVTACIAQRWWESIWVDWSRGETGESLGDMERSERTVGWRVAMRVS